MENEKENGYGAGEGRGPAYLKFFSQYLLIQVHSRSIFACDDFLFYGFVGQGLQIGFSHGVFVPPRLICIRIFYHSLYNASIALM